MDLHAVMGEPGAVVSNALFPLSGYLSLVVKLDDAPGLEVGIVGCEGMLGLALVLGGNTMPWHVVVQGAGSALQIQKRAFNVLLKECPVLRVILQRYAYVMLAQTGSFAACNRFHSIYQRLSRWLLMSQDRANSDSFQMTQEFLAYMLGVRRVSITQAATALQNAHLIEYRRGEIHVLDRAGLETAACHCYANALGMYGQAFPHTRPSPHG
ncbi:MAG: Crp/Fnr family transcriptional regulator [Rhodoferax sp.]|nr:Crp/Fnr family transcriptional regulator [Rhodoferax sp.]